MKTELKKFLIILCVFLAAYVMPVENQKFQSSIIEAFAMLHEYAVAHVLLCLVPAFFIAGSISVFISQDSVIKYFGPDSKKWIAYTVASVSGTILAVCSCTVLPMFAGIYMLGAGLGPATTFLYSGPAINIMAIIVTARILGLKIGIARAVGAVLFSIIIGFLMHLIFINEEKSRTRTNAAMFENAAIEDKKTERPLWKTLINFFSMVGFLIFANWAKPFDITGLWAAIYNLKWVLSGIFLAIVIYTSAVWFNKKERKEWLEATWKFTKQILPLLFGGVLIAGFLFGRPAHEALIPSKWITYLVGNNSLGANLFSSIAGAFMYFATLTEVPILQGLLGSGMSHGPALSLLLAGPALSLPSMLVINKTIGLKKTFVYVSLVVIMATITGFAFGGII